MSKAFPSPRQGEGKVERTSYYQVGEKVIFRGLFKNAQMQGSRKVFTCHSGSPS